MTLILFVIGGIAFFLLISLLISIDIHNCIIAAKNRVKRAWGDVIAFQVNKMKVIPELEKGIKGYQEFEQGTLTKLIELRSFVTSLSKDTVDVEKLEKIENHSRAIIDGLRVTFENYPQLKTSDLYSRWMKELSEIQANITAAIGIFNAGVEEFNNRIQSFPGSMVNSIWNKEFAINTFTDTAASGEFGFKPSL